MTSREVDRATDSILLASRALVAVAARSLAGVGDVTLPQFRALVVLARAGGVSVSDLAAELDVHPSTVTRLCDRLVRKGLVRRVPRTADDRREVTLSLTPLGRGMLRRVSTRRRRELVGIVERMSRADRRDAARALRAFTHAAGELDEVDAFGWTRESSKTRR
jgi:DNA-binding MarR family transcriptional regulator